MRKFFTLDLSEKRGTYKPKTAFFMVPEVRKAHAKLNELVRVIGEVLNGSMDETLERPEDDEGVQDDDETERGTLSDHMGGIRFSDN